MIERYFGDLEHDQLPRLREGLRLALAVALDRRQASHLSSQSVPDAALASASPLTPLLVLPFATLTTNGEPAVPTPVVIVPPDGLLPVAALAAVVFVVTVVVLRRQLLRLRIGSALRARVE